MSHYPIKQLLIGAALGLSAVSFAAQAEYALVDKAKIVEFFGTDSVKLVFVSEGKLYYADFSEAAPQLKTITAVQNPVNPVISPAGDRVTYACGKLLVEDAPNRSESAAWVCDLAQNATPAKVDSPAFVPRFVQNSPQPTLLYSTNGCGNEAPANYAWNGCGQVVMKTVSTKEKTVLWAKGSWYGGLSYDGKWLATAEGLKNAFLIDISSSSPVPHALHKLRLVNKATGRDTLLGFQTCNPSVSSSRSFFDAMMYLDVGVGTFCGNAYTVPGFGEDGGWDDHTRVFISRSSGNIARYYRVPGEVDVTGGAVDGKISGIAWNYPEWSNHPYYSAATLDIERYWDQAGDFLSANERIYALNLHDSAYLSLVMQTDTSYANLRKQNINWPWLWVETPDTFAQAEDKSWLDRSIRVIYPAPSLSRINGFFFTVKNGSLQIVSKEVVKIELFSLTGGLLKSVSSPRFYGAIPLRGLPGALVVRCMGRSGGQATEVVVNPF